MENEVMGALTAVIVALLGLLGYREYSWRNGRNSKDSNPGSVSPEFAGLAASNKTLLEGLGEKVDSLEVSSTQKLDRLIEVLIEVREIVRAGR